MAKAIIWTALLNTVIVAAVFLHFRRKINQLREEIKMAGETQAEQNAEVVKDIAQVKQDVTAYKAKVDAFIAAVNSTTASADPAVAAALADLLAVDAAAVAGTAAVPDVAAPTA